MRHAPHADMVGRRYGHLVVVARDQLRPGSGWMWQCRCDCGKDLVIRGTSLRNGNSKSCGCTRTEKAVARVKTHGRRRSRAYGIWAGMIQRCTNPKRPGYSNYGGRGIAVCKRWLDSFEAFHADMGDPPSASHSLDRKDSNGNYCPENCRWATRLQQSANQPVRKHKKGPKYRGVFVKNGKFIARVGRTLIGTFDDAVTAALAYDDAAVKRYGDFACRNFPSERAATDADKAMLMQKAEGRVAALKSAKK